MRITRETLLNIARDTVAQRARRDRNLLAAYLCGSLLEEDYLLGGAADIDLVLIHDDNVPVEREIQRLTDEVHLDIAHHSEKEYRQARNLRVHPWLGPTINSCKALHDPRHFIDFTQASVRGQYHRADQVFARAHKQVEKARQVWLGLQTAGQEAGSQQTRDYLRTVAHAANAISSLSGPPPTERRFLLTFLSRAEAVRRPGLYAGLLGLLGAPRLAPNSLAAWVSPWQEAYEAIPADQVPARLHPARRLYYQGAFEAMLASPRPETALWPMLHTWTMAVGLLPEDSPYCDAWRQAFTQLGLYGEAFAERLEALDAYLDLVDETLEDWARANGAWNEP